MAINEKNKEIIFKQILKYRTDLRIEDIQLLPHSVICRENKNISRYNTNHITGYRIHKSDDFLEYLKYGKKPFIISFKGWETVDRRLTYMEYLYCVDYNLVTDKLSYIPIVYRKEKSI
jgi:hypothetical protein